MMKPSPKAMPMKPMPRARVSGVVRSATAAFAAETLPVITPASMRDTSSTVKSPENAHSR